MKNNQNTLISPLKIFHTPLQPSNLLSIILLFAFGSCFGILLTFQLKNISFNFRFNEFSLSTTTTTTGPTPVHNMGLQDFINPTKIMMHNMSDQELIWRASMVPKVQKYPFKRIPKVAFMFLTRGPVLLSPLWDMFFKGHNGLFTIYVHSSDLSSNWTQPINSVFHGRKIPSKRVQWGKVNMIEAERRLLANALLDFSNERFVLLSESCIPLFNFKTIYNYLINSNQNFVESYDLMGPVGRGRYSRKMYPIIKLHEWRKGSQWFEMDRHLALEVISDTTYFSVFQNYCNGSCYADEHYLPTFATKKYGARNSRRTLTFVDWSRGGPHPARYTRNDVTIQFLEKLRSDNHCEYNGRKNQTCHLFARKFTSHALDRLLRLAPKLMQFDA
uniref:glycosyltransferase BC10-like n=1 Tax=Erigeron canadensis TaxID=72917 RepID=UPI001CB97181|nr:glycosyltransferase BC10-like [Erigeron canadensis]